jgi:Bacterial regulatory helix-turn-helix protein, lysR family
LNVTQGAVSHQVKALEAMLGLQLFHRERQRLILTEAGREYLTVIRDALEQIAVATERLLQRQESGILTVSTSLDFAAKWLVNRLSRFAEKHPEIDLDHNWMPIGHRSASTVFSDQRSFFSWRKSWDASASSQSRKVTILGRLAVAFGQMIQ